MPYEIGYGGVSKLPYLISEPLALNISNASGANLFIPNINERSFKDSRRPFIIYDLCLITNPKCFTDSEAKAFIIKAIEECLK